MNKFLLTTLSAVFILTFTEWAFGVTPQLLKNIAPGSGSGIPREFVSLGGFTYFLADDESVGFDMPWQLWRTDGTTAGTVKITDLPAFADHLKVVGNKMYFQLHYLFGNDEFWSSDGTALGTQYEYELLDFITEINSRLIFANFDYLLAKEEGQFGDVHELATQVDNGGYAGNELSAIGNSVLYFVRTTAQEGKEIWKTDGTTSGTMLLKDIVPGAGSSAPQHLKFWNGALYFQANNQIWRSDGSTAGTQRLDTGSNLTNAGPFLPAGNHFYFGASNAGTRGLYRSNGSVGHVEFLGAHPGLNLDGRQFPQGVRELGGKIIFDGWNAQAVTTLWSWDKINGISFLLEPFDWEPALMPSRIWDHVFTLGPRMYFPDQFFNSYSSTDGTPSGSASDFDNFAIDSNRFPGGFPGNDAILRPEGILFAGYTPDFDVELYLYPIAAVPEITVEAPSETPLVDGTSTLAFFSSSTGASVSKNLTIRNIGTASLTGLAITKDGANASDFTVSALGSTSLAPGASMSVNVSFVPTAVGARTAAIQISSNDSNESSFDISLSGKVAVVTEFAGPGIMSIHSGANASPYPSTTTVSGISGPVHSLKIKIGGFYHSRQDNVDMFLMSPSGAVAAVMSDAGDQDLGWNPTTNIHLVFDDNAAAVLPEAGENRINSGTYRVANFEPVEALPPGGSGMIGTSLNALTASDVNGDWKLFVSDDGTSETGFIQSWSLVFEQVSSSGSTPQESWRQTYFSTTSNTGNAADLFDFDDDGLANLIEFACNLDPTTASPIPQSAARSGENIEFTYPRSVAAVNSGVQFVVEWSDDLPLGNWSVAGVSHLILSNNGTVQQMKATLPAGSAGRRFVRLSVNAAP